MINDSKLRIVTIHSMGPHAVYTNYAQHSWSVHDNLEIYSVTGTPHDYFSTNSKARMGDDSNLVSSILYKT